MEPLSMVEYIVSAKDPERNRWFYCREVTPRRLWDLLVSMDDYEGYLFRRMAQDILREMGEYAWAEWKCDFGFWPPYRIDDETVEKFHSFDEGDELEG